MSRLMILLGMTLPGSALAASGAGSGWGWNLLIALVVLVFTVASAALPIAALRQWTGLWRYVAALPLLFLLLWAALIVVSKLLLPGSHSLWSFEIFAWAMLNMIYMVVAMTAKRQFQKADEQAHTSD